MDRNIWELMLYYQHLDRIKNMKSNIDNKEPKKHPFTNKFIIDKSIQKNRLEMENKIIGDRILKSGEKSSIDNKLSPSVINYKKFKQKLLFNKHKVTIDKINNENKELVKRLINTPPVYNHKQWEQEFIKKEIIKKTMLLFPEYYKSPL
jgi:hypothetical protein